MGGFLFPHAKFRFTCQKHVLFLQEICYYIYHGRPEEEGTLKIVKMAALYTSFKLFVFVIFLLVILVLNASGVSVEEKLCDKYCDIQKFDEVMEVLMSYGKIPGAQLAVAKGGEVKYFKAFGVANRDTGELLTTHHIMRYNSISKFITGVAILQLIQVKPNYLTWFLCSNL